MAGYFEYKLEYNYDNQNPYDASCYIQMRHNVPIYRKRITKEEYDVLPPEQKHPFLTGLFNISGVVEVSSMAYRVWLMKATAYQWWEVLWPVLYFLMAWYSDDELFPILGSAQPEGTPIAIGPCPPAGSNFVLDQPKNRRSI